MLEVFVENGAFENRYPLIGCATVSKGGVDPFDRMIAAQALAEDIPVLNTDTKLDAFSIRRIR